MDRRFTASATRRTRSADCRSTTCSYARRRPRRATSEPARRGAATGRRIPVDFAVSTFESRGEQSSIAVLIDITDRLENDHLRDTFIGILSHELRTPVTAIYGGSQVLLGRGERLDPAVSRELITDIAAESERLHRLIENLLVLARVERGEELIGGEPVLLQRVLPTIVEREREIWLGHRHLGRRRARAADRARPRRRTSARSSGTC